MKRLVSLLVVVELLVLMLPTAAFAAPSLGGLGASPSAGWYSAPPAQGGLLAKVAALWIQLYEDPQLQTLGAQVWQSTFLEVGRSCGNARYVQAFTLQPQVVYGQLKTVRVNGAKGWMDASLFAGQVHVLPGAFLPPEVVERSAQAVQSISHCQRWLECNGYSRAGTGRVWGWLDRTGILTTHPEDCIPYRRMPRPRGCYP